VAVRRLGYAKVARRVEIVADQESRLDFAVEPSAGALDEVVVTGTIVPTEQRAIPNPVSVVTAEDIQRQSITRVDQLFRTSIPGAMSWDQGTSDYTNSISVRGTNSLIGGANSIKIYVDGIEAASNLFTMVDVNSIDRIEVIRGPQASTIYGSEASGGVMQIFTKKGIAGTQRPSLEASISATAIESPYKSGTTLRQDHSLSVRGSTRDASYHLGASYARTGEWVPLYSLSVPSFHGGARAEQGPLTLELSARYSSRTFDDPWNPILRDAGYAPYRIPPYMRNVLHNQTYGARLRYASGDRWQHNLAIGVDRISQEYFNTRPRPDDSLYTVFLGTGAKANTSLNSSVRLALGQAVNAVFTGGIDHYAYTGGGYNASGALAYLGSITSSPQRPARVSRYVGSNTGTFTQAQVDIANTLFLTAGARAEWNTGFGSEVTSSISPRVGLALVRGLGNVEAKLHGSYGEAIKPPAFGVNRDQPGLRANPRLGPERQVGSDVGLDLHFGTRATLSATYYDQTAIDLIDFVLVDGTTSPPTFQYQNAGKIGNRGMELEGKVRWSTLDLRAHYSLTQSKVRALGPLYTGALAVGDRLLAIPKHSAGLTATYAPLPRTSLSTSVTYMGSWVNTDMIALYGYYFGGDAYRGSMRAYWLEYPSITKLTVGAQHSLSATLTLFLSIQNAANNHRYESSNVNLTTGRQTTLGLRASY
jgi:outer membrane receptor protein involved in Fe transport